MTAAAAVPRPDFDHHDPEKVITMSHEQADTIDTLSDRVGKLLPWMRWLVGGAFVIGIWVTTLEIRTQSIADHDDSIRELEKSAEKAAAIQYTATEAAAVQRALTESINAHALRIQRTEDEMMHIRKALDRIEAKLEARPAVQ